MSHNTAKTAPWTKRTTNMINSLQILRSYWIELKAAMLIDQIIVKLLVLAVL